VSVFATAASSLFRDRLQQRVLRVPVVDDIDLRCHVVGQVVQLLARAHRHQHQGSPFLNRKLHDADCVVDRVDGAAEVDAANHDRAGGLGLEGHLAELLVHVVAVGGAGIDGEADGHAAQAQSVLEGRGHRGDGVGAGVERIGVVGLEDQGQLPGVLGGAGLEEAERSGVGVAAGVERQLEVIPRVVACGVRREAARRTVLEALVHGQDHELAGAGQAPAVHESVEVGERAGVPRGVTAQDLADSMRHAPFLLVRRSFIQLRLAGLWSGLGPRRMLARGRMPAVMAPLRHRPLARFGKVGLAAWARSLKSSSLAG